MKILHQMADLLYKNNKVDINLCITTSLALLTLEKLSYDDRIDNGKTPSMYVNIDNVIDIMQRIADSNYGKNISDAYRLFIEEYSVRVQSNIHDIYLSEARLLAREFIETGLLSKQSIKGEQGLWLSLYDNRITDNYFMPKEISDLFIGLADIHKDDDVCVEWDTAAQLGIRASEITSKVVVENPSKSCIPLFIDILSESNITFEFCDPIVSPGRVSNGRLHCYDVTLSRPPFSVRSDVYKKAVDEDWFNRFPEKTNQGNILAIRHLLSTTKKTGIIAVQDSILISPGMGYRLRENLINQGVVNTVISMPSGLLPHTTSGFSILILTPLKSNETIRFVDLRSDNFYTGNERIKTLSNLDKILELVLKNNKSKYVKDVTKTDIEENGYNLHPGKYILDQSVQSAHNILENENIDKLGNHVDIIRPRHHRRGVDSGLTVLEIGAADIPSRGYIDEPLKHTLLGDNMPDKNFAKYKDIVLVVKGVVGKVSIVPSSAPQPGKNGWIIGQSSIILRVNSDKVDPDSLLIYLRSNIGQSLLNSIASGSTIQIIKLSDLIELPIIIPDTKTKEQMSDLLEKENKISHKIKTLYKEQTALTDGIWSI